MPRPTMAPPRVSYAGWKYVEYFRRNNPENVVPDRGAAVPTKFQSFISVPRLFWVETLPQCRIYGSCDREPTDVYMYLSPSSSTTSVERSYVRIVSTTGQHY